MIINYNSQVITEHRFLFSCRFCCDSENLLCLNQLTPSKSKFFFGYKIEPGLVDGQPKALKICVTA